MTWALDVGEWSASCPGHFTPSTHWIGGSVGPRAGLDMVSKRKIPSPCWESNPDHLIVQHLDFISMFPCFLAVTTASIGSTIFVHKTCHMPLNVLQANHLIFPVCTWRRWPPHPVPLSHIPHQFLNQLSPLLLIMASSFTFFASCRASDRIKLFITDIWSNQHYFSNILLKLQLEIQWSAWSTAPTSLVHSNTIFCFLNQCGILYSSLLNTFWSSITETTKQKYLPLISPCQVFTSFGSPSWFLVMVPITPVSSNISSVLICGSWRICKMMEYCHILTHCNILA
jgi:hypothetical protein